MPLLSFDSVSIAFASEPLLDDATLPDRPRRARLPDRPQRRRQVDAAEDRRGQRRARRRRDLAAAGAARSRSSRRSCSRSDDATVFDVVAGGLHEIGALLAEYHHVSHAVGDDPSLAAAHGAAAARDRDARRLAPARARRRTCSRSTRSTPTRASASSRAAGGAASRWRARWSAIRICCCSTSRPTTSTSR